MGDEMETVAILIVLASLGAGLFGLINLVKPLGLLRIRRRRYAAAVVAGAVVAFFCGGLLGAASQPGGLKAGAERAAKEREARAGAGEAPKPAAAVKAAPPPGVTQIEFNAVWGATKVVMARCDDPLRRAGEIVGTGDVYAAYPAVQRAEQECNRAMMLMRDIDPPKSAKGAVKRAFLDAREACSTTAFIKGQAMEKLGRVINGDARPSAVSDAKAEIENGQMANVSCIAKFAAAATAAGLTLPEFQDQADPAPTK